MKVEKFLITFLITFSIISCGTNKTNDNRTPYSIEKLYGEWSYVNEYDGTLNGIDTIKNKPKRNPNSNTSVSFKNDGTFFCNSGDYFENGKFHFDVEKGFLTEIYISEHKEDTLISRVTFLDDLHMLVVVGEKTKEEPMTFYYRKK